MTLWKKLDHWTYEYFQPNEPASTFPEAEAFVALWHEKRQDRTYPARSDFDWYDLEPWWSYIGISHYSSDPFDYEYSLFGTKLAERFQYEATGKKGSQFGEGDFDAGEDMAFYQMIAEGGYISRASGTIHWQDRSHVHATVLVLPLSSDGKTVTDSIELLI